MDGARPDTRQKALAINHTPDVLARIQAGDPSWEVLVPAPAVATIVAKRLFGYRAAGSAPTAL